MKTRKTKVAGAGKSQIRSVEAANSAKNPTLTTIPRGGGSALPLQGVESAESAICHIKSIDDPKSLMERALEVEIPLAWVDKMILQSLHEIREAADFVQMSVHTHPSWLRVWNAVNSAISNVEEMKCMAVDIARVMHGNGEQRETGMASWARRSASKGFQRKSG